jgi:bacillithiol biosynthesis deacetylase BshB1
MQLDVLAIGAHPDDVELGCAGTVAACVRRGYKVGIVDLTRGEMGTRGNSVVRSREAKEAARILGVVMRTNLGLPDGGIHSDRKSVLKLIQIYRHYRPRILLIPHWHERHPDHVHAHHLAREAWFLSGLRKIVSTYKGSKQQPWRPRKYFHYMQKYQFTPSFIVDVSGTFDVGMSAVRAHRSQFYDPTSKEPETMLSRKEFLEYIETRAKYFGEMIGARYGEGFYSVETVGTRDIVELDLSRK